MKTNAYGHKLLDIEGGYVAMLHRDTNELFEVYNEDTNECIVIRYDAVNEVHCYWRERTDAFLVANGYDAMPTQQELRDYYAKR